MFVLSFDFGPRVSACVLAEENKKITNTWLLDNGDGFMKMPLLQDNLLGWLERIVKDTKENNWPVELATIELHWGGKRPGRVSQTTRIMEYCARAYLMGEGMEVRMVTASTYKRKMKACTGSHKTNKEFAAAYVLENLPECTESRTHDIGDAAILAEYSHQNLKCLLNKKY